MRESAQTTGTASAEVNRPALYLALTKPDVSFLVVMTTVAGYSLGTRGPLDWLRMAHTVFGTTLIAAGTSALNHYFERDTDALMRRTASRPLPSGQLRPREAFWLRFPFWDSAPSISPWPRTHWPRCWALPHLLRIFAPTRR